MRFASASRVSGWSASAVISGTESGTPISSRTAFSFSSLRPAMAHFTSPSAPYC